MARIRFQGPDQDGYLALQLLLGIAFPGGPLPDHTRFTDLNRLQQEVVHLVLETEHLNRGMHVIRAVGECNLPYAHDDLAAWGRLSG